MKLFIFGLIAGIFCGFWWSACSIVGRKDGVFFIDEDSYEDTIRVDLHLNKDISDVSKHRYLYLKVDTETPYEEWRKDKKK